MLDDTAIPEKKIEVTPRPEMIQPVPVCTLMSDGTFRVELTGVSIDSLQQLMLSAASSIMSMTIKRAVDMESALRRVRGRFQGFDEETNAAIALALGIKT
jgi:hypothetical protein